MNKIFFILGLTVFVQQLCAQEAPIISDRPSFTTGTFTVQPSSVTVEFGYQYAFNNNGLDTSTSTAPLLATRVGLTSKAELDILWSGWKTNQTENQASEYSSSDLSIGSKYRLVQDDVYNLSLQGLLSFPTGSSPSTSKHIDPSLGFLWDYTLSSDISAFGMFQANSSVINDTREYNFQPAIGLSFSHSHGLATFIEYYSDIALRPEGSNQHAIDAGMTYLINNDLQWDINFAIGLNAVSDNYVGSGFALRF